MQSTCYPLASYCGQTKRSADDQLKDPDLIANYAYFMPVTGVFLLKLH
jgi:hypothetical protein